MPRRVRGLSLRDQRFVDHYLVDGNAYRAALRCGFSPGSARQTGSKLANDPRIKAAIDQARAEEREFLRMPMRDAINECVKIAKAQIGTYVRIVGKGKHQREVPMLLADLSAAQRAAIGEIRQGQSGTFRITMRDKLAAIRLLSELEGWLRPQEDERQHHVRPTIKLSSRVKGDAAPAT